MTAFDVRVGALSALGSPVAVHLDESLAVIASLRAEEERLWCWAAHLAATFGRGGRVLVAGNGGSAAQAQHLTSELVGRFDRERPGFSALCLSSETSSLTAVGNDYGFERLFARQVDAHGRDGDVLVALSTSGCSPNLLHAVETAHERGLTAWACTGRAPNPLLERCDDGLAVAASSTAVVQDAHQVAIHLLCLAFETVREEGIGVIAPTGQGAGAR